jgi:hypothetical protein
LQGTHDDDGDATADKIRAADDGLAPPEPGVFESIGNWLKDNLKTIGDIAGMVSAVAGALALIPGVDIIAGPVALVAGGVALAAHSANMAVTGNFNVVQLGADTLGMIPGVGAVKAGIRTAREAGESMHTVSGLVDAGKAGMRTMSDAPGAAMGKLGQMVTHTQLGAERVAKIADSAYNIGTQVPTAVGWVTGPNPTVNAERSPSGVGSVTASVSLKGW